MSDETWPAGPAVDWRAAFLSRGQQLDDAFYERDQARAEIVRLTAERDAMQRRAEAAEADWHEAEAERDAARAKLATTTALLNQLIQP